MRSAARLGSSAAIGEVFEQRLNARGLTPPLPVGELATATSALVNGLATEELQDPGSVPDELLAPLLTPDGRVTRA